MSTLTWSLFALSALSLLVVIYPYAIYPLALSRLSQKGVEGATPQTASGSSFALLFCAFNESESLPAKIANLSELRNRYPELEILAYDDLSTDPTAAMLEAADINIRVLRGTERHGKAHGMKRLVASTSREFLIFTDANVTLDLDAVDRLAETYHDESVGGVCGDLRYYVGAETPTSRAGGAYWALEEKIKELESRSGNVMGADGSVFSVRRSIYPDFPDTVLDDLTVSMSVIFAGLRLVKDARVVAYEDLVSSQGEDMRRRMRIATRAFHTHMWFAPQVRKLTHQDQWRYYSHRYLRWIGGPFLAISCVAAFCAIASISWQIAIVLLAAAIITYWASRRWQLGPLSAIAHICTSIVATSLGAIRARRGDVVKIWRTPRS